jgi:protein SCO1/2
MRLRARLAIACAAAFVGAMGAMLAGLGTPGAHAASDVVASEHHHHVAPEITRTVARYPVPSVRLVRADGRSVTLSDELGDDRPVVLTFVYTTCTTICPLTSMTLAELQRRLGAARDHVHLMSISIDPEQDTPARLRDYARKFGAGAQWQHYTGSVEASAAAQRAFGVYRGNKMDHGPVTLVRVHPEDPWTRLEGFATADQLLAELGRDVAGNVATTASR